MIFNRNSDGTTPRITGASQRYAEGVDCCCTGCTGTCGETACPCTVTDAGASLSAATCAVCAVPGHEYTHIGIRWRPTKIGGITLTVPEGGIEADDGDDEVLDLTASQIDSEILADATSFIGAPYGLIHDDLPTPSSMPTAASGPYAWENDDTLEGVTTIRNTHPFSGATGSDSMSASVTTACAVGRFDSLDDGGFSNPNGPYAFFHNFHTWYVGFTPDITNANASITFVTTTPVEWPGINSTDVSVNRRYVAPHVVPDKPPFAPLVPNVSYERGSLNWWTETRFGLTDDEEPCVCVRVQVWYYGYFILGESPDDSSKFRRMRIRGLVFEHESKIANTNFCDEKLMSLSTNHGSSASLFIDGYSGGSLCLAPYKFKVRMCRATKNDTAVKVSAPWAGGDFYTGTNQWFPSPQSDPPSWTTNATSYTGPHTITSTTVKLNTGTAYSPTIRSNPCGILYDLLFPPGSTATTDHTSYPTTGTITGTHDGSYWIEVAFHDGDPGNTTVAKIDGGGLTILSGPLTMSLSDWSKIESAFDKFQLYTNVIERIADTVSGGGGAYDPTWRLAGNTEFPDEEVFEPQADCECADAEDIYNLEMQCEIGTNPSGWVDMTLERGGDACTWTDNNGTYTAELVHADGDWTLTVLRISDSEEMFRRTWTASGSDPTGTHYWAYGFWEIECPLLAAIIT